MVRVALLVATMLAASSGLALPLCSADEDEGHSSAEDPAPEPAIEDTMILPCAALENGVWGQVCLDGQGYLVTDAGVVLCQVFKGPFGVEVGAGPDRLEDDLPYGASSPMGSSLAAVLGDGRDMPPVLVAFLAPPAWPAATALERSVGPEAAPG